MASDARPRSIRPRDLRAILFCALTSVAVVLVSYLALKSVIVTAALVAAWLCWLLTRPRMRRVIRRLRGEPSGWSGYYWD